MKDIIMESEEIQVGTYRRQKAAARQGTHVKI
jgi:hypothetical protein